MKKFIWILVGIFICFVGLLIFTYIRAMQPVDLAKQKAIEIAINETEIVDVDDFGIYHGQDSIAIVEGKDKKGQSVLVFIPEKGEELVVRNKADGISKKQAIKKVNELTNPKKIMDVRIGMEMGIPIWEIYYLSEGNLINYYHLDFETGEWLKKIENL
jgi:uncharacterized protein YpmB